ncbi:MAG: MFS transporter [Limnobacter sp.]|nr:MFS transporter [Limnobacter sp.]
MILFVATLAIFTDSLLYSLIIPVLPEYIGPGASTEMVGVLVAAYAGSLVIFTPFMGFVVDRYGNKLPTVIGFLGLMCASLLFGFSSQNITWLFVARVLQGIACAATATASLTLLAQVFDRKSRGKAMGIWTSGNAAGTLLGPFLGGLLYEHWGPMGPMYLAAGLALFDVLARLFILTPHAAAPEASSPVRQLFSVRVLVICGIALLSAAGLTMIEVALPIHLYNQFSVAPTTVGLYFILAIVSFGIFAPLAGYLEGLGFNQMGRVGVCLFGLLLLSTLMPAIAVSNTLLITAVYVAAVGAAAGIAITPAMPALADAVEDCGQTRYGFVYSLFNISFASGAFLGPLLGAFLIRQYDLAVGLLALSGLMFAGLITIFCFSKMQIKRLPKEKLVG